MQQAIQAKSEFNVLLDRHLYALVESLMKCAPAANIDIFSKFQIPFLLLNFQAAQSYLTFLFTTVYSF